jgi:hypothetical protein
MPDGVLCASEDEPLSLSLNLRASLTELVTGCTLSY